MVNYKYLSEFPMSLQSTGNDFNHA